MQKGLVVTYIGGGWGNAINMVTEGKSIVGWKPWSPAEGSILFNLIADKNKDRITVYEMYNIHHEEDPWDMFEADIRPVCELPNTIRGIDDIPRDWYKQAFKEYNELVLRHWNSLPFYKKCFTRKPFLFKEEFL